MIKTANKTPYEIRLELLQLANIVLAAKHHTDSITSGALTITSPSTEEIIAEAEKMNVFVSKANSGS